MGEIVAALPGASNRLINVEDLTEAALTQSHSIEEAERRGRLPKKAGGDTSHQS